VFWGIMKNVIVVVCVLSASIYAADKAETAGEVSLEHYEYSCGKADALRAYWSLPATKQDYSISVAPHWVFMQDFYGALVRCVPTQYAALRGDLAQLQQACERMIPCWGDVPRESYIQMIEFFLSSYQGEMNAGSDIESKEFKS
jgi:hypothetical protein